MNAPQRQARHRRQHLRQLAFERQRQQELTALLRRFRRDLEQRRLHAEYVREMRGVES